MSSLSSMSFTNSATATSTATANNGNVGSNKASTSKNSNSNNNSNSKHVSRVRVGVRVRPLTSTEIAQSGKRTLTVDPQCGGSRSGAGGITKHKSIMMGPRRQFTYDTVFDSNCGQVELYDSISEPLLTSFVDGYNATIMAYGQTGSGKTFTMGSEAHTAPEREQHVGLIPRFITDFFLSMKQKKEISDKEENDAGHALLDYHLQASFLEVYGEDIHDLLDKNRDVLPLREDSGGGVVVKGLTMRPIADTGEALQVLHDGTMNRTTAATLMNLTSSRSHAIFTIYLTQVTRSKTGKQVDLTTTSRFTFVDLAGSERMKKTGAEGERAREGIKINEGLLALGNVINALGDEERIAKEKKIHVPYRQSKLTRLLRDALGGNSQTLFLACVSPSDMNASETLSTLNYADRARNIRNAPTKNVDANVAELQRLHTINRVLQSELIKSRFRIDTFDDNSKIGTIDEAVMKRDDVEKYISGIYEAAQNLLSPQKSVPSPLSFFNSISQATNRHQGHTVIEEKTSFDESMENQTVESDDPDSRAKKRASTKFDESILEDINPDAEMAILDYLLELQQNEHDYEKEKNHDDVQLQEMDSELAKGEAMLLQLRESLKVYHGLKKRYEDLMAEVQQLETEKSSLAKQLEKANKDPTQGCSAVIRRKLDSVEMNLSRARRETLTHRSKYHQAEDQARKCRVLERKVNELKQSKNVLLKKQKEAAKRYREVNEAKTKELLLLKRKERVADKKVSKLENEITVHKNTLTKRKKYCTQLAEKLRQTEDHLVKLLAMRQQNLSRRTGKASLRGGFTASGIGNALRQVPKSTSSIILEISEEDKKAASYVFDSMVSNKVKENMNRTKYCDLVTEYGETMRKVVAEVKALSEMRDRARQDGIMDLSVELRQKEELIADLELKVELLDAELHELASQLPQGDNEKSVEEAVEKLMSAMSAPVLRNMLIETYSKFVEAESDRRTFLESVQRKDAALLSFETEVESLNYKIHSLSTELADRNVLSEYTQGPLALAQASMVENRELQNSLESKNQQLRNFEDQTQHLQLNLRNLENELSCSKANLAVANASIEQGHRRIEAEKTVERLQGIWSELGVESSVRDESTSNIMRCLEDTCARELDKALRQKSDSESEVRRLIHRVENMRAALGISPANSFSLSSFSTILENIRRLRQEYDHLKNPFSFASTRREKLINDATSLSELLAIPHDALSEDLQTLLLSQPLPPADADHPEGETYDLVPNVHDGMDESVVIQLPQGCLELSFLTRCEEHVGDLRVKKAQLLADSRERQQEIAKLIQSMHLNVSEVLGVVVDRMRESRAGFLEWWNQESAKRIVQEILQSKFIVTPDTSTDRYLSTICDALTECASARSKVSEKLKTAIEVSQRTLLDIVGRELDAREAYAGFHDALFRLPPLSKDLILSCISELEALIEGIEAMTGSEIEALTVVWEALKTPAEERSDFWGAVEQSKSLPKNHFAQDLSMSTKDEASKSYRHEDWMIQAIGKASEVQNELQVKLFKLGEIHSEVERLRTRQEAKSQILSLDAEIRVMNAKLVDFEDFQCDKHRLISKKNGGSALLKEERFRKQMQTKFASHLDRLGKLLREWEKRENSPFDASALSEDVRELAMQNEPGKMGEIVENRTKLMSLRTVKTQNQSPATKSDIATLSCASASSAAGRQKIPPTAGRVEKKGQKNKYQSGLSPPRKRRAMPSQKDPFGLRDEQTEHPKALYSTGKNGGNQPSSQRVQKLRVRQGNEHANARSDTQDKSIDARTSVAIKRARKDGSAPIPPFGRILDSLDSPNVREPRD